MASGKKNYFRHSFFARNDIKLRELRDRVGIGFYFYFFTLLEQCGETSSDQLQSNYEFHDSIIRNLWCVNLKKSERVANEMMAVGLLFFEKREKTFYFEIPNFSKYLGKYETKNDPNAPNKRKENKIKINKIKENESKENNLEQKKYSLQNLIQKWNDELGDDFGYAPLMPSKKMVDDFITLYPNVLDFETWDFIFEQCKKLNWLNGNSKSKWRVNLLWLLDYNNFVKVISSDQGKELNKSQQIISMENPYE